MKPAYRQILARQPFEEKIRKVGQLIELAKKAGQFRTKAATPLRNGTLKRQDFAGDGT